MFFSTERNLKNCMVSNKNVCIILRLTQKMLVNRRKVTFLQRKKVPRSPAAFLLDRKQGCSFMMSRQSQSCYRKEKDTIRGCPSKFVVRRAAPSFKQTKRYGWQERNRHLWDQKDIYTLSDTRENSRGCRSDAIQVVAPNDTDIQTSVVCQQ